jgi:hypothetical protein
VRRGIRIARAAVRKVGKGLNILCDIMVFQSLERAKELNGDHQGMAVAPT